MKRITQTLIAVLCFVNLHTYAQTNAPIYEFYGSITKNLKIAFKPVATMIKVDVDKDGKVAGIELSDSAPDDVQKQFETNKSKLNIEALRKYVELNNLKGKSFMIPYNVSDKNFKIVSDRHPLLTKFDGKDYKGKAKVLSPINASYSVTTTVTTATTKTL